MKPFRVSYTCGMVNIDSDDISFSWIADAYYGKQNEKRVGVGIQVNPHMNRNKVKKMCLKIAEAVKEFHTKKE